MPVFPFAAWEKPMFADWHEIHQQRRVSVCSQPQTPNVKKKKSGTPWKTDIYLAATGFISFLLTHTAGLSGIAAYTLQTDKQKLRG